MPISIPITEFAFPHEEGDEIIIFPCGNGWGAIYAACPLLAAADLVLQPWKG